MSGWCSSLSSWGCSNLTKYTWIKLALLVLVILVNVALYSQSKHIILEVILPQFGINRSVIILSDSINNINYTSPSPYNIPSDYTNNLNVTDLTSTTHVSVVQRMRLQRPFFQEKIVNPHDFDYVIRPNVTCSNRDIEIVICVAISHDNVKGRTVIRNTWGSYASNFSNNALLVFFLGSKIQVSDQSKRTDVQENVLIESSHYSDILQEDFIDSYNNLSLKSVSILKWVRMFCSEAKFILKVDDDMYVNIPLLVKTLREFSAAKSVPNGFLIGSVQAGARPIRNRSSKWYTPVTMFADTTYPKYVSGTAYAMTAQAVYLLYEASLRLPIFWLEDVYITGLCARKASVEIYNSEYFSYGKPSVSGCSFRKYISGHRYTHEEIVQIHKELYDPNLKC